MSAWIHANRVMLSQNGSRFFMVSSFSEIFGGHQSLRGGPLIHLIWTFGDVCPGFQSQGRFPPLDSFITCTQWIPQTHICCDTRWPLGGQHGRFLHTSIVGAQVQDQSCCCFTACEKTDTLPNELWRLGSFQSFFQCCHLLKEKCVSLELFVIIKNISSVQETIIQCHLFVLFRIYIAGLCEYC